MSACFASWEEAGRRTSTIERTYIMQATQTTLPALTGFGGFLEQMLLEWTVPGLAVGIVKDGAVALAQGYGERNMEEGLPVTPHTLFAIGSISKWFTATALAMLADEGALDWDTPLIEYLSDFRLFDPIATQFATATDLITHQVGLPPHELAWYGSPLPRRQIYERLRYLAPNKSFRARFEYSNLMYVAAGILIEALSGQTWEEFVRSRIFAPLEMSDSNLSVEESRNETDAAQGYTLECKGRSWEDCRAVPVPFRNMDAAGPAGGINSSATDMAKWLLLQLNNGKVGDTQLVSEVQMAQVHAPRISIGQFPYPEILLNTYCLGLRVCAYRGYELLHSVGSIDGFISSIAMVPSEGIGVVVLANQKQTSAQRVVLWETVDRLLGLAPVPWNKRMHEEVTRAVETMESAKPRIERICGAGPSHDLEAYTGQYEHPGYGRMTILREGGGLRLQLNAIDEPLVHRHYDIFDLDYPRKDLAVPVTFLSEPTGDIKSVSAPIQEGVSTLVFDRVAVVE
jgi:CubicO group peptidase (beta-lactamase class C family)